MLLFCAKKYGLRIAYSNQKLKKLNVLNLDKSGFGISRYLKLEKSSQGWQNKYFLATLFFCPIGPCPVDLSVA